MMHLLALLALVSVAFPAGLRAADPDGGGMTIRLLHSPWDANAWEPGGGRSFWRAGAEGEKPQSASPTGTAASRSTAPSDPAKTAPRATASPETAAKPDFSNRQPEK
ncbi:MAG: hypothetical protein GXX91_11005 [Verrucomicrobiaceae bacterium]|nr:hypothetical protein [Verrucomicrobiaceae bacterium]